MQPSRLDELLRAERTVAPEPGADDRIWAAIEHRLSHGPPPPAGAEAAPAGLGGAAALKVAAGLALVAAVAGGLAAGGGPGEHVQEDRQVAVEPVREDSHAVAASREAPVVEPSSEVPVVEPSNVAPVVEDSSVAPAVAPSSVAAAPEKKAPARARRGVTTSGEPEPARTDGPAVEPSADDFAAELQVVAEIRRALKRGDHGQALAKVDEHARRFGAGGQLVQERLAYQVEALCGAGRVADARRVAADLLARWPDSTHAPRVRSSCAGA